jgi:hypothetical protein
MQFHQKQQFGEFSSKEISMPGHLERDYLFKIPCIQGVCDNARIPAFHSLTVTQNHMCSPELCVGTICL